MFPIEKRIAEWLNQHMVTIALGFVVIAALWMRMGGRNFVGNDYHYSLYDIPGNCNSWLYRKLAETAMRWPDHAVALLKLPAYAGDFAVAVLALALARRKLTIPDVRHSSTTPAPIRGKLQTPGTPAPISGRIQTPGEPAPISGKLQSPGDPAPISGRLQTLGDLRTFFALAACLLSPVALIYSVGGMEIDSVCMSLLLAGILLFDRGLMLPAVFVTSLTPFLYPAYWPVVIAVWTFMMFCCIKDRRHAVQTAMGAVLIVLCLAVSVYVENRGGGYFWGKIFAINPASGEGYADFGQWLLGMCRIYGYFFATGGLVLSFWHRRLRIPALVLQILVVMYVGWQQTSFLAV